MMYRPDTDIWDSSTHVADVLPQLDVPIRIEGDVPGPEPHPFAVDHDEIRLLLGTNRSLTRCLPLGSPPRIRDPWGVRPGYTQLYLYEKRAVARCGELVRLWAGHTWRDNPGSVVTVREDGRPMALGAGWPLRSAVNNAVELSGMIDGPVLLVSTLDEWVWH